MGVDLDEYIQIKEKMEEEIRNNPANKHELTMLYSPLLNKLACDYVECCIENRKVGDRK